MLFSISPTGTGAKLKRKGQKTGLIWSLKIHHSLIAMGL